MMSANLPACISHNPYRILGVYGCASRKDILSHINRLKAYAKVHKRMTFPNDMAGLIVAPDRSLEEVAKAESQLTLPMECLKYSLFWFTEYYAEDRSALEFFEKGDFQKGLVLFEEKRKFTFYINIGILNFLRGNFAKGIQFIAYMIQNTALRTDFIEACCGKNFTINEQELAQNLFLDSLLEDCNRDTLLQDLSGYDSYIHYILQKYSDAIRKNIVSVQNVLNTDDDDIEIYPLATELIEKTEHDIEILKKYLDKKDIEYTTLSDNIAEILLKCCVKFYNTSDTSNVARHSTIIDKVLKLIEKVKYFAVSQKTQEEIKKHTTKLQEIKENLKYEDIITNISEIVEYIDNYKNRITDVIVNKAQNGINILKELENKAGRNHRLYKQWSHNITAVCVNLIGAKLEERIEKARFERMYGRSPSSDDKDAFREMVEYSIKILDTFNECFLYSEDKKYVDNLHEQLDEIYKQIKPKIGCYIATLVYGEYTHPQVKILREFRDRVLLHSKLGAFLVQCYYKISPKLVEYLKEYTSIHAVIRTLLNLFVKVYCYVKK